MSDDPQSVMKHKINTDPDFINLTKASNSLKKAVEMFPNGMEIQNIAKALLMSEKEVEEVFDSALKKLRSQLLSKDDLDE